MSEYTLDISVKTINNESFSYSISSTTIVSELKRLLRDSTTIEIPRQRLIFRGRVLQDDLLLTDYSIVCGNVLHMVARPVETEALVEGGRNSALNYGSPPQIQSTAFGFHQFSSENSDTRESQQESQLQRLSRNELELLNQLMTGEPHGQLDPNRNVQTHNQQETQRQLFSSDLSSYSFQSSSRFALLPNAASVAAPAPTVTSASTIFSPSTSVVSRPNVNSSSHSVERIRQGLLTMETIISTMSATPRNREYRSHGSTRNAPPASGSNVGTSFPSSSGSSSKTDVAKGDVQQSGNDIPSFPKPNPSNGDDSVELSESIKGQGCSSEEEEEEEVGNKKEITVGKNKKSNEIGDNPSDAPQSQINEVTVTARVGEAEPRWFAARAEQLLPIIPRARQRMEIPPSVNTHTVEREREREAAGGSRRFFVGQWVDVKDTVSQWLEATIMMVDLVERRVFVHYNGWPVRWDEWLPFMTPRIAPFRTRTLHAPQYFHTLPSPNAVNLPNVRSSLPDPLSLYSSNCRSRSHSLEDEKVDDSDGGWETKEESREERGRSRSNRREIDDDNVLSVLPTIARMMRSLQPQIDAAARIASEVLSSDDDVEDGDDDNFQGDRETERERERIRLRNDEFRILAEELCPLVDRFGRILADLSPLLRVLGFQAAPPLSSVGPGVGATWGTQNPLSPDYFPAPEHPSNNMLEMSLASLLRPRAPSPPPLRAFRQPISTTAQPPLGLGLRSAVLLGAGSLGIGIDPQAGVPGFGGVRGATRLGFGGTAGGIFDIHIAVLPPSRREGSNIITAGSALPVPLTSLSGVAADLAMQSLIFVPQENVTGGVSPVAPEVEVADGNTSLDANISHQPVGSSLSVAVENSRDALDGVSLGAVSTSQAPLSTAASHSPVISLILPGASTPSITTTAAAGGDSDGMPPLIEQGDALVGEQSSSSTSSVAFSTWLDARREEREMEREIDRLRAMLRNREQEYEEAIRSILSLEGTRGNPNAVPSTQLTASSSSGEAAPSTENAASSATVGSSIENASPSVQTERVVVDGFAGAGSRNPSYNSNSSSSSTSSSNGSSRGGGMNNTTTDNDTQLFNATNTASPTAVTAAMSELADTDDSSVSTPSTAVGSLGSASTDTGIVTVTTLVGSREEDRLTVENSSNSDSRGSGDIPDGNTQISLSTYSDAAGSSEEVFPSTVILGSSSLDSDTSSSRESDTNTSSSFQFDLRAAHGAVRSVNTTVPVPPISGSTEGEGGSAYAGYDLEKDFESLSSGSITGETIDAYIGSKDIKQNMTDPGSTVQLSDIVTAEDVAQKSGIIGDRGASAYEESIEKIPGDDGKSKSTLSGPNPSLSSPLFPNSLISQSIKALSEDHPVDMTSFSVNSSDVTPSTHPAWRPSHSSSVVHGPSDVSADDEGGVAEKAVPTRMTRLAVDQSRPRRTLDSTVSADSGRARRSGAVISALQRIRMSFSSLRGMSSPKSNS